MRKLRSIVAVLALLAPAAPAEARIVRDQPYSRETTWNTAIRLIRVDLGCPITERDVDNGYFTFDWRDGRRSVPGSIEVIPTQVDGRPGARVIVQIAAMPSYVEAMVLTRLSAKLRADFGEPAAPPPRERPPERPREPSRDDPREGPIPVRPPSVPIVGAPIDPDPPMGTPPISPDAPRPRRPSADD